uniref:Uncharacterized protein n=1 Tax=Timema poppense TaxID=170557 RepID=A0A7R9HAS7_TIMPO|nr:unnamed protein product [Timema poppensis]
MIYHRALWELPYPSPISDYNEYSNPMASLVLTDSSQLTSDSQHLAQEENYLTVSSSYNFGLCYALYIKEMYFVAGGPAVDTEKYNVVGCTKPP